MSLEQTIGEISEVLYATQHYVLTTPIVRYTRIYSSHFLTYKHPSLIPRTDHQSPDLHNIIKRRRLGEYLPRKLMKSSSVSYIQPIVDRRSLSRWKGLQQCVSSERAALPQYISKPKATAALTAVSWSFLLGCFYWPTRKELVLVSSD